ncbi:gamma-glutamyl-gamma-aminobutyrate hydrolase family protein [bacterium]|nr:gamma-glutamyl-gamma-aminobutyrate hydrolase family protein [bacterium]
MKIYVAPPKGKIEKETYINWITSLGFNPTILDMRFKKLDGPLLLCGGADIGKNPERDEKEFKWIKMAIDCKQPIIGICKGMQILNQFFGGTVEDLDGSIEEYHSSDNFAEDSDHGGKASQFHFVKNLDDQMFEVNSRHHQWCSKIADNFKVTHMSFDGGYIPEAIEDEELKIVAVQWHPEREESPMGFNIFKHVKHFKLP